MRPWKKSAGMRVEVVVVEEGVLERCQAAEGREHAREAVSLAIVTPFAAAPSVLVEKVNDKRVPAIIPLF